MKGKYKIRERGERLGNGTNRNYDRSDGMLLIGGGSGGGGGGDGGRHLTHRGRRHGGQKRLQQRLKAMRGGLEGIAVSVPSLRCVVMQRRDAPNEAIKQRADSFSPHRCPAADIIAAIDIARMDRI